MTKKNIFLLLALITTAIFTSCIQEEAPNAECDIVSVDEAWLEENKEILSGTPLISNSSVRFYVKDSTDIEYIKTLDPKFNLTPGASIKKEDAIAENGDGFVKAMWCGDEACEDNEYKHAKLAEYLERAVYYCPFCGLSEFESHKDIIKCKKCNRECLKYRRDWDMSFRRQVPICRL